MKYLIFIFCLLIPVMSSATPLLSYGNSSEDTLSISLQLSDSLGNPGTISADSFLIIVIGPSGDSIVAINGNASALSIDSITSGFSTTEYIYTNAVINLVDTLRYGLYQLSFCGKSTTYALSSCRILTFQLLPSTFGTLAATINESLDSLQSQDNWVAHETTLSGISTGSGLYSYTFVAIDSSTDTPLHNIAIAIRNLAQTELLAAGQTANNGTVSFNLNSDTVSVITSARDYQFSLNDTVIISGSGTDTLYGYPLLLTAPANPQLCRVYGYLADITGTTEADITVTASLPGGVVTSSGYIISPFTKMTTSDSTGYFYLDLIPSDSLQPIGQLYEITISRTDGTILRRRVTIPALPLWQLSW